MTAAAALAAFAVLLAATGPHLASLYAASGIASCHGGNCLSPASHFLRTGTQPLRGLYLLGIGVILLRPPSSACSGAHR